MRQMRDSQRGVAMLLVLLTVSVLILLGLALAELSRANLLLVNAERQGLQALDLAEAGLNRAVAELWSDPEWSGIDGATISGADGSYSVTVALNPAASSQVIVTSTGTVGPVSRTVRGTVRVLDGIDTGVGLAVRQSLSWLAGDLAVNGTTQIDGDLLALGGSIEFAGQASLSGHVFDLRHSVAATPPVAEAQSLPEMPAIDPALFHADPWESLDVDYSNAAVLDNNSLKDSPRPGSSCYIAHVNGSGTIRPFTSSNKLGDNVTLVVVVADGSLTIDGQIKAPKNGSLLIIAGGDIYIDGNCKLDSATLMAGGNLSLAGKLDVTGSVVADTVIPNSYSLDIVQQASAAALPLALDVSLLTWEEVTQP